MKIQTRNPATGEPLAAHALMTADELAAALQRSRAAFGQWRRAPVSERRQLLLGVAAILERERDSLARLMQEEMGKAFAEGRAEIEKCAACARYYHEEGEALLRDLPVPTEARRSYVSFAPLGPVLAIMPWNFPFWQAFRCALPALLAGNSVLLKHAANVTGCALAIERIFREASPTHPDILLTLVAAGKTAHGLIARPEVAAVSFTGSTEVGKAVAAAAGGALKKCVLELGGSDPFVVLADADASAAARVAAQSRLINAGQSCIAAKRFIVEKPLLAAFRDAFLRELQARPLAPLARADLREALHGQVQRSVAQGARLTCGGMVPEGPGYFYPATLLEQVRPGMAAFEEELFGPVAALVAAESEQEALALANQSRFGLGATVFSGSSARAERIARDELEAGSCFGNALVRSDPRLPFGGVKDSGFGRELSAFGLREFTNIKTVYIGG